MAECIVKDIYLAEILEKYQQLERITGIDRMDVPGQVVVVIKHDVARVVIFEKFVVLDQVNVSERIAAYLLGMHPDHPDLFQPIFHKSWRE